MAHTQDNKKTVEILWTGGYDSTFRIVQLSKLPVIVKPYYLQDNRGICEEMELLAVKKITEIIKNKPGTQCDLLDLEIIPINKRIYDSEITRAYNKFKEQFGLGSQYEWLACFAKIHPGIELSLENCESPGSSALKKYVALKTINDPQTGKYSILDEEKSQKDAVVLFKDYHFPILDLTKLEMKDEYIRYGCEDVMNLTWFCFTPVNREPCGLCNPCKITINEGLRWRFSPAALKRNRYRRIYKTLKHICVIWPSAVNLFRKVFRK